jgi:hypothetical protein
VLGWAPADDGLDGFAAVEQASRPLRQPAPAPELEEHCAGFEYLPSASYAPRPAPRGPPAQAPKIQPNPRSSSRPPRLGGGGARPRSIDRRQTLKPVRSRSQTQRTLAPPLASGSPRHVGSGRGRGSRPIRSLDLVRLHAITALVLDALPARDVAIATRLAEARHRQTARQRRGSICLLRRERKPRWRRTLAVRGPVYRGHAVTPDAGAMIAR